MKAVHPRITEAWLKTPGAFRVAELLQLSKMEHPAQLEWYRRRFDAPLDAGEEESAAREGRKRKRKTSTRELRIAFESGVYDRHGEEWKAGALAVLEAIETGVTIDP